MRGLNNDQNEGHVGSCLILYSRGFFCPTRSVRQPLASLPGLDSCQL